MSLWLLCLPWDSFFITVYIRNQVCGINLVIIHIVVLFWRQKHLHSFLGVKFAKSIRQYATWNLCVLPTLLPLFYLPISIDKYKVTLTGRAAITSIWYLTRWPGVASVTSATSDCWVCWVFHSFWVSALSGFSLLPLHTLQPPKLKLNNLPTCLAVRNWKKSHLLQAPDSVLCWFVFSVSRMSSTKSAEKAGCIYETLKKFVLFGRYCLENAVGADRRICYIRINMIRSRTLWTDWAITLL